MAKAIRIFLAALILPGLAPAADPIELPPGMGGVPDIGAVPCSVFSNMLVIGQKGVRHSLLTWTEGYLFARTGKTLDEIILAAPEDARPYDFFGITDRFIEFCADNPEALTRDAVLAFETELLLR